MSGGFNAWNGRVAEGDYGSGLAYFSCAANAGELLSLSEELEEGNRVFYERLSGQAADPEAAAAFRSLSLSEKRHKEALRGLAARIAPEGAPSRQAGGADAGTRLEDGSPVGQTLDRLRGAPTRTLLEFSIAMEANAMDRYIKMWRAVPDEPSRALFLSLAEEEKSHIERMAALLERLHGER